MPNRLLKNILPLRGWIGNQERIISMILAPLPPHDLNRLFPLLS